MDNKTHKLYAGMNPHQGHFAAVLMQADKDIEFIDYRGRIYRRTDRKRYERKQLAKKVGKAFCFTAFLYCFIFALVNTLKTLVDMGILPH